MPRITQVELKGRIYKQMQEIKELHTFMKELREENEELKDGFTKEEASVFLEENEKLKKEKDVTPLQSLTNLTELYLSDNQIVDVTPLQSLTNLTVLYLNRNQIPAGHPSVQVLRKQGVDVNVSLY